MRNRAEILDDGLRATKASVAEARSAHQINLLTLEALLDIRDELNEMNNILATVQKVVLREL